MALLDESSAILCLYGCLCRKQVGYCIDKSLLIVALDCCFVCFYTKSLYFCKRNGKIRRKMIIIADRQDITRIGLTHVADSVDGSVECRYAEDKATLIELLKAAPDSVVYIDYTLFDIGDASELQIIAQRYSLSLWVLFSDELSYDFISQTVGVNRQFGIVLKDSSAHEIRESVVYALDHRRYICQRIAEMLINPPAHEEQSSEIASLTKTETEILKLIALGMTTKEIAEHRFSSFHTVNTHRKNIFRKLGVNNAHEATKIALRAGLVDSAEYYI